MRRLFHLSLICGCVLLLLGAATFGWHFYAQCVLGSRTVVYVQLCMGLVRVRVLTFEKPGFACRYPTKYSFHFMEHEESVGNWVKVDIVDNWVQYARGIYEYVSRFPLESQDSFELIFRRQDMITLYKPYTQQVPCKFSYLRFPFLFPVFLLFTYALGYGLVARRCRRRSGRCQKCAYDLTGNESGVCPECGTAASEKDLFSSEKEVAADD